MTFQIRPAQLTDVPSLADLLRSIGYFSVFEHETPEQSRQRVAHHLKMCLSDHSHSVYVATRPSNEDSSEEELVGYLSVHWLPYLIHKGPEGYISELFIREAARGQGAGTALLDAAVHEGRERGCGRMMLVNMRQRESYQRDFYKKQGWEEREDAANFVLVL